jgi:hypothetical protein
LTDRLDTVSLIAGVAVAATGVLLLLDQEGVLDLSLGLMAATLAAVLGAILVASGLSDGRNGS